MSNYFVHERVKTILLNAMILVFFQETYNNISTVSYDYECEEFDDISDNAKVKLKKMANFRNSE